MSNVYDINLTNDLKNAFIRVLRIVFESSFLKEYQYNIDPRISKIFINTSYTQQAEKKPAIIISASGGHSNLEHHNEEVIEETKDLSHTEIATNDPQAGNDVIINIADTSNFTVGDAVYIVKDNLEEQAVVTVIDPNVSITVDILVNDFVTPNVSKLIYTVKNYGGQKIAMAVGIYALSDKDRNRLSDFLTFAFRYLFIGKFKEYSIAYNKISISADGQEEIEGQLYYTKDIEIPCYTEYQGDVEVIGELINLISKINLEVDVYTED